MKCPYCDKEMQLGCIHSRDGVYWTETECLVAALHLGGGKKVKLAGDFWVSSSVAAYLCEDCKKVILDYSESQEQTDFSLLPQGAEAE